MGFLLAHSYIITFDLPNFKSLHVFFSIHFSASPIQQLMISYSLLSPVWKPFFKWLLIFTGLYRDDLDKKIGG